MNEPNAVMARVAGRSAVSAPARAWVWPAALFAVTLISRLPFAGKILYHWDSVNFAYALRSFNVAAEQPQPPGYILYVGLARWVNLLAGDAQTTMTAISILASALAVAALYFLGSALFDRRAGVAAALFLAASPLYWFYGEIALPHSLDLLLATASAWGLLRVLRGDLRWVYPTVLILAVAGGVRQQTVVFLLPLTLYAFSRVGWRRFVLAGVLGALLCLAWLIPLAADTGGLSAYLRVMGQFSDRFQDTTSLLAGAGLVGLRRNALKLGMYTVYAWAFALLPAGLGLLAWLRRRDRPARWDAWVFLALWVLPAFLYYLIIHMGQQGLVFVFLPALLLGSAAGLGRLLATRPRAWTGAVLALALLSAAVFLFAPEYPLGAGTQRLLTRATLAANDRYFQERFDWIRAQYPPERTVIVASNWRHVEYYLPEYRVVHFDIGEKWEVNQGQALHAGGVETIGFDSNGATGWAVLFDADLTPFNQSPSAVISQPLSSGGVLDALPIETGQALVIRADGFGLLVK